MRDTSGQTFKITLESKYGSSDLSGEATFRGGLLGVGVPRADGDEGAAVFEV